MKQRYILDYDDILGIGFLQKTVNAENLINGINKSASSVALAVSVGGLGSKSFSAGQTLIFDGQKMISSGYGPQVQSSTMQNDGRYYTKAQIDAMFASLANPGSYTIDYSNLSGAPEIGIKLAFLASPIQVYSGQTVMGAAEEYIITSQSVGQTVVAALVTATCKISNPDGINPAVLICKKNLISPGIDAGWFRSAGGDDSTAGCTASVIPVDEAAQSFFYQLTCSGLSTGATCANGPVVLKLVGYLYK